MNIEKETITMGGRPGGGYSDSNSTRHTMRQEFDNYVDILVFILIVLLISSYLELLSQIKLLLLF